MAEVSNFLIFKYTIGSAAEASYRFCAVTAPERLALHIKARDTLLPGLCAVWMSPLPRGLRRAQAAEVSSAECWGQQAWLFLCCREDSHAYLDIL